MKMRNTGGGGNFTPLDPIPSGNHVAILYQILEYGTLPVEYQGETKMQYKISLTWELPEQTHEFEDKETGQMVIKPRVISKEYTLSSHEKSGLRLMIESWRGRKFKDDAEAEALDIEVLLGKPCFLNITHAEKGDKVYSNIGGVSGVPAKYPVPEQYNGNRLLSYQKWDWELFNSLPSWIREKIEGTQEFKSLQKPTTTHRDGLPAPQRDKVGNPTQKPGSWKDAAKQSPQNMKEKVGLTEPVSAPFEDDSDDLPF
jgi:hypothetical protein